MSFNFFGGIDCGLTGAIAIVSKEGHLLDAVSYEEKARRLLKIFREFDEKFSGLFFTVEKPEFSGFQKIENQMKYIETFYRCKYLLELLDIPFVVVRAKVWKPEFKLGKEKKLSNSLVLDLFDNANKYINLVKDHNKAEAILIAEYGRRLKC